MHDISSNSKSQSFQSFKDTACNTLILYHTLFCSAGADPEHRGGGEQEDRGGGVSILQAGSQLPRGKSATARDSAVTLPLLPRRAQEQQGPGSFPLLSQNVL